MKSVHIGVDVSKEKLDVYIPATKEGASPTTMEVDNNTEGFRKLRELARKAKATVCVEPTGGYELELIAFMHKFDVEVAYADALRVRQFARAEGNLSKNDAIDAALISRFADKIGVRTLEKQDVDTVELKRKTKFRQTLTDARTAMILTFINFSEPMRQHAISYAVFCFKNKTTHQVQFAYGLQS